MKLYSSLITAGVVGSSVALERRVQNNPQSEGQKLTQEQILSYAVHLRNDLVKLAALQLGFQTDSTKPSAYFETFSDNPPQDAKDSSSVDVFIHKGFAAKKGADQPSSACKTQLKNYLDGKITKMADVEKNAQDCKWATVYTVGFYVNASHKVDFLTKDGGSLSMKTKNKLQHVELEREKGPLNEKLVDFKYVNAKSQNKTNLRSANKQAPQNPGVAQRFQSQYDLVRADLVKKLRADLVSKNADVIRLVAYGVSAPLATIAAADMLQNPAQFQMKKTTTVTLVTFSSTKVGNLAFQKLLSGPQYESVLVTTLTDRMHNIPLGSNYVPTVGNFILLKGLTDPVTSVVNYGNSFANTITNGTKHEVKDSNGNKSIVLLETKAPTEEEKKKESKYGAGLFKFVFDSKGFSLRNIDYAVDTAFKHFDVLAKLLKDSSTLKWLGFITPFLPIAGALITMFFPGEKSDPWQKAIDAQTKQLMAEFEKTRELMSRQHDILMGSLDDLKDSVTRVAKTVRQNFILEDMEMANNTYETNQMEVKLKLEDDSWKQKTEMEKEHWLDTKISDYREKMRKVSAKIKDALSGVNGTVESAGLIRLSSAQTKPILKSLGSESTCIEAQGVSLRENPGISADDCANRMNKKLKETTDQLEKLQKSTEQTDASKSVNCKFSSTCLAEGSIVWNECKALFFDPKRFGLLGMSNLPQCCGELVECMHEQRSQRELELEFALNYYEDRTDDTVMISHMQARPVWYDYESPKDGKHISTEEVKPYKKRVTVRRKDGSTYETTVQYVFYSNRTGQAQQPLISKALTKYESQQETWRKQRQDLIKSAREIKTDKQGNIILFNTKTGTWLRLNRKPYKYGNSMPDKSFDDNKDSPFVRDLYEALGYLTGTAAGENSWEAEHNQMVRMVQNLLVLHAKRKQSVQMMIAASSTTDQNSNSSSASDSDDNANNQKQLNNNSIINSAPNNMALVELEAFVMMAWLFQKGYRTTSKTTPVDLLPKLFLNKLVAALPDSQFVMWLMKVRLGKKVIGMSQDDGQVTITQVVTIGSNNNSNVRTVTNVVPEGYKCPARADFYTWAHKSYLPYPDDFKVEQTGKSLKVTRTNGDSWGTSLEIYCWKDIPAKSTTPETTIATKGDKPGTCLPWAATMNCPALKKLAKFADKTPLKDLQNNRCADPTGSGQSWCYTDLEGTCGTGLCDTA